jgi:oxygen-independent coproporphyrinogen III oxidase
MAPSPAQPVESLYIHVPFCARKCDYCAFYSEPAGDGLIERYVTALVRELELAAADLKPRTIYFGGGTPSLLTLRQWENILRAIHQLDLSALQEWTVECNPATVSLEKARLLRSAGVNRLSMGVQSFDESLLDRLGRVHTRQMAFDSFDLLRQAGFDNLNLDLMFAIPGQTLKDWQSTLTEAVALGSEHLSTYEVIYEEDTPLYEQLHAGRFDVDEDLACAMYEALVERATEAGFQQYEVANFARDTADPIGPAALGLPARACQHNVNYWRGGSFHGLGPSATSYLRGVRTKNLANTRLYCEHLEQGRNAVESSEELPPLARAGETAAFGLRMVMGWPFQQFQETTGYDLRQEWAQEMTELEQQGHGRILPDRFQLTPLGLRFADAAAQLFLR